MREVFQTFLKDVYAVSKGSEAAFKRLKTAGHLAEGQDSTGGFLVPEQTAPQLYEISLEESIVRPRARIVTMESDVLSVPSSADSSHATTIFGGVTVSIPDEGGALTANVPSLSQVILRAKPITCFCYLSNEWMSDTGVQIESFLRQVFGAAIGHYSDWYFINGTGSNQPLGILHAPALIEIAKEENQVADTINWTNVIKMDERLHTASQRRAIWLIHPESKRQIFNMTTATNSPNVIIDISGGPEGPYLLWHPVIPTEKCKKVGDKGDIILADFGMYIIGNRSLTISVSSEYSFNTDETCWKIIYRVDGQPLLASAQIPMASTSSQTVSPFVALADRA